MRFQGPNGLCVTLDVVDRLPDLYGRYGDFAVDVSVVGQNFAFTTQKLWVEQDQFEAFVADFDKLARTRAGRAELYFMSPNVLEVLAVSGTSDLVIHGRIESGVYAGGTRLPVVLDFNSLLDAEYVELALTELKSLFTP